MPSDPTLYLYTSLTAGSSHIITATSRIETILKAHKIPFKAVDCATDDKARMLWQRRSKNRKLPGLVKFNDVIADYEAIEDLNEHGELEDHIEDQIDIFGDVPISATSKEAHETAAARAKMQAEAAEKARQEQAGSSVTSSTGRPDIARTASETRHISISEPDKERKDSVSVLAMKAASAEAAKKAGEKKTPVPAPAPAPAAVAAKSVAADGEEVSHEEVSAKTPEVLAEQGAKKVSVDKADSATESSPAKSNEEQIADMKRKSSVPEKPSALAKSTSISEAHTIKDDGEEEESEEDSEDSEDEDEEEDADEDDAKAPKVVATSKNEGQEKTQNQKPADSSKAGVSVGD